MDSKRTSRRDLLKGSAAAAGGLVALGQTPASAQLSPYGTPVHDQMPNMAMSDNMPMVTPDKTPMIKGTKELIEYGQRSHFVTSVRMSHPMGGRPSPDMFGKTFHVAAPLQDSVGVITPSSLHYFATTRGSYVPDIDPRTHSLTIHGLVDRPLTFTMEDLKPAVRHTAAFHRVCGKPPQWPAKDRAGIAWHDQLRRMDRRAAFHLAQGVRP